ncbi:hypothetical protein TUM16655_14730 [Enterobacter cloacae]|nr:hypothetical protein TUM16655_14730 [Enterobacter cloacae]
MPQCIENNNQQGKSKRHNRHGKKVYKINQRAYYKKAGNQPVLNEGINIVPHQNESYEQESNNKNIRKLHRAAEYFNVSKAH